MNAILGIRKGFSSTNTSDLWKIICLTLQYLCKHVTVLFDTRTQSLFSNLANLLHKPT